MFEGIFQPTHLIILLVIALLIVGPKKLPEMGRSLGSGMRGFRDAINGKDEETPALPPQQAPQPMAVSHTDQVAATQPVAMTKPDVAAVATPEPPAAPAPTAAQPAPAATPDDPAAPAAS